MSEYQIVQCDSGVKEGADHDEPTDARYAYGTGVYFVGTPHPDAPQKGEKYSDDKLVEFYTGCTLDTEGVYEPHAASWFRGAHEMVPIFPLGPTQSDADKTTNGMCIETLSWEWQLAGTQPNPAASTPLVLLDGMVPKDLKQIPVASYQCSLIDQTECLPSHHGVHVASTAALITDAATGTLHGLAPGVPLHSIQVLDQYGYGTSADLLRGLARARRMMTDDSLPSKPIVVLAVEYDYEQQPTWEACAQTDVCMARMIDLLVTEGALVVAAAGNKALGDSLPLPGCMPGVVSVGAHNESDQIVAYTAHSGPDFMDFVAPGLNVEVADRMEDGTLELVCEGGTSLSAAIAAAAIGVVASHRKEGLYDAFKWTCEHAQALSSDGVDYRKVWLDDLK